MSKLSESKKNNKKLRIKIFFIIFFKERILNNRRNPNFQIDAKNLANSYKANEFHIGITLTYFEERIIYFYLR